MRLYNRDGREVLVREMDTEEERDFHCNGCGHLIAAWNAPEIFDVITGHGLREFCSATCANVDLEELEKWEKATHRMMSPASVRQKRILI